MHLLYSLARTIFYIDFTKTPDSGKLNKLVHVKMRERGSDNFKRGVRLEGVRQLKKNVKRRKAGNKVGNCTNSVPYIVQ